MPFSFAVGRFTTTADIARELGVSKMAVSLALRGRAGVSAGLRARVLAAAQRMGYRPDASLSRVMSAVKARSHAGYCGTIALINADKNPKVFSEHPTLPEFVRGIERGAARLGYNIDRFWLYDPRLDAEKLARIFRSRGIEGGVVAGIYQDTRLPEAYAGLWREFKFVAAGVRTQNPRLDYASADQFLIARNAVAETLKLGYCRPGLVLDGVINDVVEGRFAGGFLEAQLRLKKSSRVPIFFYETSDPRAEALFGKWFLKHSPDVVLCLFNTPKKWLENMGLEIPADVALVQLERRKNNPEWAGMNQRNDIVGEAAVARLSLLLNAPPNAYFGSCATIISPDWCNGATVGKKRGGAKNAPKRRGDF